MALFGESEEDLRVMVRCFTEAFRKRGVKVKGGKSKVMMLGVEERLECEACVHWIRLEHVAEFKYLGCALDESGTDEEECCKYY